MRILFLTILIQMITTPKNNAIVSVTKEENNTIHIGNKKQIIQETPNTIITNSKVSPNENKALANHSNSSKETIVTFASFSELITKIDFEPELDLGLIMQG